MADSTRKRVPEQVFGDLESLREAEGLPFHSLLPKDRIQTFLEAEKVNYRAGGIFTPFVTLWAFLSQVLCKEGSCESAVARVLVHRVERRQKPCSMNTASYCEARQKLPEGVYSRLARNTGRELHQQSAEPWKWKGRLVEIVDGSTAIMPDTPANQKQYPQSRSQKPGLGFPILRFVVLLSLSVGTVLECAIGPCRGKKLGELNLFRQLRQTIQSGTVLLGDRYYDSYVDIAELRSRGVDVVFGMKNLRKCDFRRGRKLGPDDHIVVWTRPRYDSTRFDSREVWAALPKTMEVRECRMILKRRGYQTRVIVVVTTLLDAEIYSKSDLMELFAQRWHCELDLRCIKSAMGMSQLRCKSPEMVRKELWMYLLAYNLIRTRMSRAASVHGCQPRQLSFQSAKTFLNEFMRAEERAQEKELEHLESELLKALYQCRIGDRPGRKEPRAVKKRENKYPKLKQAREQARKGLPA
jgi:hypothetical protein